MHGQQQLTLLLPVIPILVKTKLLNFLNNFGLSKRTALYYCCKKRECNKMDDEERAIRLYEARLQHDIREIESEINRLQDSKQVLQRLLMEARNRDGFRPPVKRRNSVDRVMIETAIRRSLYGKESVKSRDIYEEVKKVSSELKHSTFRSHLHRMKEKGLILQQGRGAWKLA